MVKTFFKLNHNKIRFAFIFCVLCTSFITCILLAISFFNNQLPETSLLITVLVVGCVGLPIFMITLVIILSLLRSKTNVSLFDKIDTLKNNNISIEDTYVFEDTKWYFTDSAKKITVDETQIIAFVHHLDPKNIRFEHKFSSNTTIKNQNIDHLKLHDIEIDPYANYVSKIYSKKKFKKIDIRQLRTELKILSAKIKELKH